MITTFAAQRPFKNIKNLIISGYGATFTMPVGSSGIGFGGVGIVQNNTTYANFVTSSAGAQTVTLVTAGETSRFTVGNWVAVTGGDLQGAGYPPNPFVFEYAKVQSIGVGTITFEAPLANAYKSTWPNFFAGSGGAAYSGGPATLYALDPSWDTTVEVRGLSINDLAGQTNSDGRSITYRDVTMLDGNGAIASQNFLWECIDCDYSAVTNYEADKLVETLKLTRGTFSGVEIQSSSIKNVFINGTTITNYLFGTGQSNTITNATINNLGIGSTGYGSTQSVTCTTCSFAAVLIKGVNDTGTQNTNAGVNKVYSMASGTITIPRLQTISAVANNGGLVKLTIGSTAAWTTGQTAAAFCGGSCGSTDFVGTFLVTVDDGTHLTLQGSTFAGGYTSGGQIGTGAVRWAVPGARMFWQGASQAEKLFTVTDVTGDAANTYVATDAAGGFPTLPLTSGKLYLQMHPSPAFTCTTCTGSTVATSLSQAPPGAPLFSYWKATYNGTQFGTSDNNQQSMWGSLTSLSINVTQAYTGTNGTQTLLPAETTVKPSDGSGPFYAPTINTRITGNRVVTISGVTGNQSGDANLALAEASQWFADILKLHFNNSIIAECGSTPAVCPSITVEMTTNQGFPFLLKRDVLPEAANDNTPMFLDIAA